MLFPKYQWIFVNNIISFFHPTDADSFEDGQDTSHPETLSLVSSWVQSGQNKPIPI